MSVRKASPTSLGAAPLLDKKVSPPTKQLPKRHNTLLKDRVAVERRLSSSGPKGSWAVTEGSSHRWGVAEGADPGGCPMIVPR